MKLNQLRNQLAGFPSVAPISAAPHRPIPFSAVEKLALPGIFRLLLPLLLLLSLPAVVQAQFIYETNNGTITITGYTGPGGALTIPSTISGLPVTSIGNYAFAGSISLTSVMIPGSVTVIGLGAFYYCSDLTSVTIHSGVTNIVDSAFLQCTSLASITIPSSVTSIGQGAFNGCTSMTDINVDGSNAIYRSVDGVLFNKSLTMLIQFPVGKTGNYTIPSSVTSISYQAFYVCVNLAIVTIGSGIASIDSSTFYGCTSLTSVTIPSSVTRIWNFVFSACTNLNGIYFQGDAPVSGDLGFIKATVFYLPGTSGWGSFFGNRPTALWVLSKPLVLTNGTRFGVKTNRFGFIISWATNLPVVVEASTSLAAPDWSPVATNTLTAGASYFSDPEWTNYPNRFYRLRSP